jgi:hypothetical protein
VKIPHIKVSNNPKRSSFNLSELVTFGGIIPINKCVVNLETNTVAMSPIKALMAGRINMKMGILYRIASFKLRTIPETNPMMEERIRIMNDSFTIFIK